MEILSIDVYLADLPLTEPFVASHGTTTSRTISALRLTTDIGTGWGECSALPAASYTAESAVGSFRAIVDRIAPELIGHKIDHASIAEVGPAALPHSDLSMALDKAAADLPMARSCIEMAVLDGALTAAGIPLARWLAGSTGRLGTNTGEGGPVELPTSVPAGVSIGLASVAETVETCKALAAEGYQRLKVKIEPGHDLFLVEQIRKALPDIELHVDANGSYPGPTGPLLDIVSAGANVVEQPFPADATETAAQLIAELAEAGHDAVVVADEAVQSHRDAQRLLDRSAMTGLSIKPGRVGGIMTALSLHDLCVAGGIAATAGGMLETGLGRHGLVALAALPGFTLTGDMSPAARWLKVDPWPDLTKANGRLIIPTTPGVCEEPDLELLATHTIEHATIGP